MDKKEFIQAGYNVVETENNENKLLSFLKEHYPSVVKDNEINLNELKAIAGLPIDDKVNGYGLNFIGRNFARAKYAQKTEKELQLNTAFSKNLDTTQNLVLKGDNLDSLKILKNHYSGKIKMIYIDPPYNTANDEFVYPDKFDKEEAEVLGLANLSEDDFARMDFSFKTKKSHNGWLSFMYPRLLLARDLLSKDGVIFISIDDNEQANLKLLCDDVFGEENFLYQLSVVNNLNGNDNSSGMMETQEYCLIYTKNKDKFEFGVLPIDNVKELEKWQIDEKGYYKEGGSLKATGEAAERRFRPNLFFPIYINENNLDFSLEKKDGYDYELLPITNGKEMRWYWNKVKFLKDKDEVIVKKTKDGYSLYKKQRPTLGDLPSKRGKTTFYSPKYATANSNAYLKSIFNEKVFNYPKSFYLLKI